MAEENGQVSITGESTQTTDAGKISSGSTTSEGESDLTSDASKISGGSSTSSGEGSTDSSASGIMSSGAGSSGEASTQVSAGTTSLVDGSSTSKGVGNTESSASITTSAGAGVSGSGTTDVKAEVVTPEVPLSNKLSTSVITKIVEESSNDDLLFTVIDAGLVYHPNTVRITLRILALNGNSFTYDLVSNDVRKTVSNHMVGIDQNIRVSANYSHPEETTMMVYIHEIHNDIDMTEDQLKDIMSRLVKALGMTEDQKSA